MAFVVASWEQEVEWAMVMVQEEREEPVVAGLRRSRGEQAFGAGKLGSARLTKQGLARCPNVGRDGEVAS